MRPCLLVASPRLQNPFFKESVILLTKGDGKDVKGVTLNGPVLATSHEILLRISPPEDLVRSMALFPALSIRSFMPRGFSMAMDHEHVASRLTESLLSPAPSFLSLLHDAAYETTSPQALRLTDALFLKPLEQLDLYPPLSPASFLAGYGFCSWAIPELVGELKRGVWGVLPVEPELVFTNDCAGLWRECNARVEARGTVRPFSDNTANNVICLGSYRRRKWLQKGFVA